MSELLAELQDIIKERRVGAEDGSYTAYLFSEGIDKILKKIGEESAETIIAAKNLHARLEGDTGLGVAIAKEELIGEIGDLLYHLLVLCTEVGVDADEIAYLLRERMKVSGNKKDSRETDRNT